MTIKIPRHAGPAFQSQPDCVVMNKTCEANKRDDDRLSFDIASAFLCSGSTGFTRCDNNSPTHREEHTNGLRTVTPQLDRKVGRIVVIIEMGSGARLSKDSFASRMNSSTASQCSSIASVMAFEVVATVG